METFEKSNIMQVIQCHMYNKNMQSTQTLTLSNSSNHVQHFQNKDTIEWELTF
jgi:hypothetical protein